MKANWLILTATLPTSPSGLRVRVWRTLKATGAGTLREGVYVLPELASSAPTLWELEHTIASAGADAHMLVVQARDDAQEKTFRGLFDRTEWHAELLQSIKEARNALTKSTEAQLRKMLRELEARLHALQAHDFFPGKSSHKTGQALAALRRDVALHLSPDEPAATSELIPARSVADYQGRVWATRKRPWVDRLGTAWLVQRFIDRKPRFSWLSDPKKCPKAALGYDFDGATFTHVGDKVSFEVMMASFGLQEDRALQGMAGLIHCIDVGGIAVDEAPGLEMLVRGLRAQHADDDTLLAAALPVFDALYFAMQARHEP